jgi:hypothetical protein
MHWMFKHNIWYWHWFFHSLKLLLAPYFSPEKCIAVHRRSMNPIWTAWLTIGVWGFVIRVFLLLSGLPFRDYELHLTRALCFKCQTLVYSDQLNLDWYGFQQVLWLKEEWQGLCKESFAFGHHLQHQSPYLKKTYN